MQAATYVILSVVLVLEALALYQDRLIFRRLDLVDENIGNLWAEIEAGDENYQALYEGVEKQRNALLLLTSATEDIAHVVFPAQTPKKKASPKKAAVKEAVNVTAEG